MCQVWLHSQELFDVLPFCCWGQRPNIRLGISLKDFLEMVFGETRHRTRCSDHLVLFRIPEDLWIISIEVVLIKLLQQIR